jgi:hypothetical protein
MTEKEFYQNAMIAAMQGLLSAIGNGYAAEYVQPHSTVASMADEYAKALTIRAEIEVAKMRLENPFPEKVV